MANPLHGQVEEKAQLIASIVTTRTRGRTSHRPESRRFPLADERGPVVLITGDDGKKIAQNSYDEWGAPTGSHTGRFGYTGQTKIGGTELWHYKARAYSPRLGRFLQPDPIGFSDGLNVYAYVHGDPVSLTDLSGLKVCDEGDEDCKDEVVAYADLPFWHFSSGGASGFNFSGAVYGYSGTSFDGKFSCQGSACTVRGERKQPRVSGIPDLDRDGGCNTLTNIGNRLADASSTGFTVSSATMASGLSVAAVGWTNRSLMAMRSGLGVMAAGGGMAIVSAWGQVASGVVQGIGSGDWGNVSSGGASLATAGLIGNFFKT